MLAEPTCIGQPARGKGARVRLLIELDGNAHEVDLAQASDAATLADLLQQATGLRPADGTTVWVDARRYDVRQRLADLLLLEGSRIGSAPAPRVTPIDDWTAVVVGGLDAGRMLRVPDSAQMVVGRGADADLVVDSLSASRRNTTLERREGGVFVRDLGSTNGTAVNGVKVPEGGTLVTEEAIVLVGGSALLLTPRSVEQLAPAPGSLPNITHAGTVPFNRPPREGRRPGPDPIQPPAKPSPASGSSRLGIAATVGPLAMAGLMIAMTHQPMYAAMALLSPVVGFGTHVEQKRRHKVETRKAEHGFGEALAAFRTELDEAGEAEKVRRRRAAPDLGAIRLRAALPTTRLWQRRADDPEFLLLSAGIGDAPWLPRLTQERPDARVKDVLDAWRLRGATVEVDLTGAGVVGIVGPREGALAVARSLVVQATTQAGPADLTVGVFCDQPRHDDWAWTDWLPHLRRLGAGAGAQWFSSQRDRSETLLRAMRDGGLPTPAALLVVDSEVLTEGRDAPARALLGQGRPVPGQHTAAPTAVSGIVIATTEEHLPAACTTIIRVGEDTEGRVTQLGDRTVADDIILAGASQRTARDIARDLARFDDPELVVPGASLPSLVRLPPLLGMSEITGEAIAESWRRATRITAPIGIGEGGAFEIDLVRDGPHGLVGGTTGSGKSEFLRSLVAGLAARNDPTRLTFILIDFKGGAAFAACERLPHTIGTVSNLDEQLADRALRALEAELRYRQQVFAAAGEGIDSIEAYAATRPAAPMPRLLVVIDEFAMLAKDYPDVLKSLVSVAAVGRTLGVHMILATQRPAGVVNDDILANTNLRVALRVQSREDSVNVVGVPDASAIGRTQGGRAFVKLGQDDIAAVQTALATGVSAPGESTVVDVHPVVAGTDGVRAGEGSAPPEDAPTDLDLLIDAIVDANRAAGYAPPRPVWPEPLGERVELSDVGGVRGSVLEVALADDPDRQRQIPVGWDLRRGNLMLVGIPGSGTSTTLTTVALTLAAAHSPDDLDLLVLDLGSRDLAPLEDLPHTVAYVGSGPAAREQQIRFMKHLRAELERRRSTPGPHRSTVVLIDGFAALREEYDDLDGLKLLEGLYRVYADGPELGIWTAVATSRSKAIPSAVDEVTTQRWLFRLADRYDYAAAGLSAKEIPPPVPGRCVVAGLKLQAHVATPSVPVRDAVAAVASRWAGASRKAAVVGSLPTSVTASTLGAVASLTGEPWRIPVGIGEADLGPAHLEVYEGEHILVAGTARSGKSSLLVGLAELLKAGPDPVQVWGLCGRRSPLASCSSLDRVGVGEDQVAAIVAAARVATGRLVLLVDDALDFADDSEAISDLIDGRTQDLLIVAAGRSDDLRSAYSHWTKKIRKSRCGVLLVPDVDYDGDLLGTMIPRKAPVAMGIGRGYAVGGGEVGFVQALRAES